MSLISCDIELVLTWTGIFILSSGNNIKFQIKYTKIYELVVTMSTADDTIY